MDERYLEQAMNVLKRSTFLFCAFMALSTVQAAEVTTLPTIRVMAESELREEVGPVPFQEDMKGASGFATPYIRPTVICRMRP